MGRIIKTGRVESPKHSVEGSLARQFDFGDITAPAPTSISSAAFLAGLRLAQRPSGLRGPDKYKELEHRRHQAQIKARRLLDLAE